MTKQKPSYFMGINLRKLRKNNIWQSNLSGNCRNHWYDNILGNLLAAECPGDRYDTPTESCFQFFERTSPRPRLLGVLGSKLPARVHWVHRRTDYRYSDWTNHGYKRHFRELSFPIIEILRPIPPLAWVPTAVIFWPTPEMSITFVTFLGAFLPWCLTSSGREER